MKFSDILKTVGLVPAGDTMKTELGFTNKSSVVSAGNNNNSSSMDIDRTYRHHHLTNNNHGQYYYQQHHNHQQDHISDPYNQQGQMNMAGHSPAIGNFYHAPGHKMNRQQNYGLRSSAGAGGHGSSSAEGHMPYSAYPSYGHHEEPEYGHSSGGKKKGSSVITALTLLSFFFFINLLQTCLKEHMLAMNPTVMVMTSGARNRVVKKVGIDELDKSFSRRTISKEKEFSSNDGKHENEFTMNGEMEENESVFPEIVKQSSTKHHRDAQKDIFRRDPNVTNFEKQQMSAFILLPVIKPDLNTKTRTETVKTSTTYVEDHGTIYSNTSSGFNSNNRGKITKRKDDTIINSKLEDDYFIDGDMFNKRVN